MFRFCIAILLMCLATPLKADTAELEGISETDAMYLDCVYRDTFACLDYFTEKTTGIPYDVNNGNLESSISNIGLYMASVAVAGKTGVITEDEALKKLNVTFTSLEKIQKWRGFPVTWVNAQTGQLAYGPKFSYADHNGNLVSSLLVVAGLYPDEFDKRVEEYIAPMDFASCYDPAVGKIKGGYDLAQDDFDIEQPYGSWYYDLLASDTRHFTLLGIAREQIPAECWRQLNRSTVHSDPLDREVSELLAKATPRETFYWPGMTGGGLFMQYLPGIFLQEKELPMGRSARTMARGEIELARAAGYFPLWGISACETPDGDGYLGWASLQKTVVTPHASVLAIEDFPEETVANLRTLEAEGMRPEPMIDGQIRKFGFTDSYDTVSGNKSKHYLSLDQGMLFLSLANYLHDDIVRQAFQKTELGEKVTSLEEDLEARQDEENSKSGIIHFSSEDEALLEEISSTSFFFFEENTHPVSGLIKDTSLSEVCSVASLGFGLAALPVAVERGYMSHDAAESNAMKALETLKRSNAQHNGMYCHFIDLATGNTTPKGYESIASSIDTAIMIAGAMVAGEYFGEPLKSMAEEIFANVDWASFINPQNGQVYMSWRADDPSAMKGSGHFERQTWDWYTDETILISLLGQAAPNPAYRLSPETMTNWQRPQGNYKGEPPFIYSYPGTLFTYMFAHCFYDFQKMGPDSLGIDWFENTRRAVIANRDWCRDNADRFPSYGYNRWGITAGSGPNHTYVVPGHSPRGAAEDQGQPGTLHPYGAAMSVPFLPSDSIAALREMKNMKVGDQAVWQSPEDGGYGLWDGFNVEQNWVSDHVFGISQGPMLLLIENARSGLIWKLMMQNELLQAGIKRAGFKFPSETDDVLNEKSP
ncbi:MAG: hypothetical protein JEZ10_06865 [Verrucomicrobia bacterium]|nr:hypothetical protein [Verrucomicrobiota bacterium]